MNGAYNIILITGEKATHEMVNNLLKDQTHFVLAEVLPSLSALLDENRDSGKVPAEILVDCGDDPEGDILELELATTQMPDSRFILLCDHIEQDIVFKAMEGGARYVFPRSSLDNKHILEELKRLVPRKHISYNGGKLITVTACSGGCGATTFACNLANELGIIARQPALFIDMDFYYAGATSYMNMVGHYGLKDILQHEDIDDHLLQSSVVSLAPSLDGIPGIGPVELPASAHNVKMRELLRLCKRLYPYTIVDLRGLSEPLSGTVGDMSELLFVIMQLTVKDIDMAKQIQEWAEHDGDRVNIQFVLNRYRRRNPLTIDYAEKALGVKKLPVIKEHYKTAIRSMNLSELLAGYAPRSKLRKCVRSHAETVSARTKKRSQRKREKNGQTTEQYVRAS